MFPSTEVFNLGRDRWETEHCRFAHGWLVCWSGRVRKESVHCLIFCCAEVLDVDGDGREAVHCRWNPFVQRHPPIRLGVKLVNAGNHRDRLCDVHQQNVGHT